jgi:hypothetical protein
MSLIKKMRKQKAVLWTQSGKDEFGSIVFNAPVEIMCRWEDKRGQILNRQDEQVPSMSTVYVDRSVKIGDKLKKGELDSNTPLDPKEDRDAFEIQGWAETPNLKAKEFLYEAYL